MFNNLLLIGEAGSGKTSFATIISGEEPPQTHSQTKQFEVYKADDGFFGLGRTDVMEIGGDNNDSLIYKEELVKAQAVLYFFDGVKFLEELKESSKGGFIGCHLRHNLLLFLVDSFDELKSEDKEKYKNDVNTYVQEYLAKKVFFVASHADRCCDMHGAIVSALTKAQEKYSKYGKRYFFCDIFMSRLHCINAINNEEVNKLFKDVKDIINKKNQ